MVAAGQPWGRRQAPHTGPLVQRRSRHDAFPAGAGPWLAWGNGRSYGDVGCNTGGNLIDARGASRILDFDPVAGRLRCESGALLADLQRLIVPHGWFLPVVPGTELITVGGAIANDVHGKNHHRAGSFGHHVLALTLLRSDGARWHCTPRDTPDAFAATVGGLGLTGVITEAELVLKPLVGTGWLRERARRTPHLAATLETLAEVDQAHEYTAVWLDCLARGRRLGRGLVLGADHAPDDWPPPAARRGLRVPMTPPISPVQSWSLRAFNALYYHARRDDSGCRSVWYRPALHPLDGIRDWNRLYGRRGFVQCQVAIPPTNHAAVLTELIERTARHGEGSFLVVLKRFGAMAGPGQLSFPRAGYTLALDFPWRGEWTGTLVRELYDVALDAGGTIYPAKDAVMTPEQFRRAFPQHEQFRVWMDAGLRSDFARRVELA